MSSDRHEPLDPAGAGRSAADGALADDDVSRDGAASDTTPDGLTDGDDAGADGDDAADADGDDAAAESAPTDVAGRSARAESLPLADRADAFAALHDQLRTRLETGGAGA